MIVSSDLEGLYQPVFSSHLSAPINFKSVLEISCEAEVGSHYVRLITHAVETLTMLCIVGGVSRKAGCNSLTEIVATPRVKCNRF